MAAKARDSKRRARSRGGGTVFGKDRFFNISLKLNQTGEVFSLKNVSNEMKIKDLKGYAEFETGILSNMQRLTYLDQGDLTDSTDIRHNDIVPGAQLHLDVWNMWKSLVEAAATNDTDWVFRLGVTEKSAFNTPNSEYMSARNRKQWLADRAFVALFVASHRGHHKLCNKLIEAGADVNAVTPLGRSPLHVAAAKGHGEIVDLLLEKGADIDAEDENGESALSIAAKYGNKDCERHLFLFRWQQRAKQSKANVQVEMFAHQYFDSAFPVWMKGTHGEVYYTQILPPGEFEGTALDAPKRRPRPGDAADEQQWREQHGSESSEEDSSDGEEYTEGGSQKTQPPSRGVKQMSTMPPIREERSSRKTSESAKKKKSLQFSCDDETESGKLPGKTGVKSKKRVEKDKKGKVKNFDEWLTKKKATEEVKLKQKRDESQKKQEQQEDKKRQADFQEKSYEQWVAEKEEAQKQSTKQTKTKETKAQQATGGRTMEEIINDIMARKQMEEEERGMRAGLPFNFWMQMGDVNLYDEIKAKGASLLLPAIDNKY